MSINLKEHILIYGTTHQNLSMEWFFFKQKLRGGGIDFVKTDGETSASWNLCLASVSMYMKKNNNKLPLKTSPKKTWEKQPKVNISEKTSGTQ